MTHKSFLNSFALQKSRLQMAGTLERLVKPGQTWEIRENDTTRRISVGAVGKAGFEATEITENLDFNTFYMTFEDVTNIAEHPTDSLELVSDAPEHKLKLK